MKKIFLFPILSFFLNNVHAQHVCLTTNDFLYSNKDNLDSFSYALKAIKLKSTRIWKPETRIKVRFMGGTKRLQNRVMAFANEWSNYCNITFEEVTGGNSDIRIAFRPGGSWSQVGATSLNFPQSVSTMNFGWIDENSDDTEVRSVVLHEFGHALGLEHEHQHPGAGIQWNRDVVIDDMTKEGWSLEKIEFNIFFTNSRNSSNYSKYDAESIMHYSIPIRWTLNGYWVGWNTTLSALDKEFIHKLYPTQKATSSAGRDGKISFSMEKNQLITVKDNGVMYLYQYDDKDLIGNCQWKNINGSRIGTGWGGYKHLFSGQNGVIYAVRPNGDLYWYKYSLSPNGKVSWVDGQGRKIGTGWGNFKFLFAGQDGVIYAVKQNGELEWYKYTGKNGEPSWVDGHGRKIGTGWSNSRHVFAGDNGVIYRVKQNGDLEWYKYTGQEGEASWVDGHGRKIAAGWDNFERLFADQDGVVYGLLANGDLEWYRYIGIEGSSKWAFSSGKRIGTKW